MPFAAPRICGCGHRVPHGVLCACQVKRKKEADERRPSAHARGYDHRWRRERADFLKRNPFCRRCSQPATVVDHITPHKGDRRLFWDQSNWQPLCAHHHNKHKQAEERRA